MDGWNGRLLFSAVGGSAGVIGDTSSQLGQGYAQASTDTGHEALPGEADFGFYAHPEALLDYAYRGVHLATRASKRVVAAFYGPTGQALRYSYLQGCSNGGRAAMMEALHFPDDYDGIIAGAPSFQMLEFLSWAIGVDRAQARNPLDTDALKLLDETSQATCDMLDGVADGVIGNPAQCELDLDALRCSGEPNATCLTAGQIETARAVYDDVVDEAGNLLSPGVPPGAEAAGDWAFWMLPNDLFDGQSIVGALDEILVRLMRHDPTFDIDEFDPVRDRDRIADVTRPLDARSTDLSDFAASGGKMIMYQGWNDFPLRPGRALAYWENTVGGDMDRDDFMRLYMVPGLVHCAGGPGAWQTDYLAPLVAWREEGEAPGRLVAEHPSETDFAHLAPDDRLDSAGSFTRPLCPHPGRAQYNGTGDTTDEANFTCATP